MTRLPQRQWLLFRRYYGDKITRTEWKLAFSGRRDSLFRKNWKLLKKQRYLDNFYPLTGHFKNVVPYKRIPGAWQETSRLGWLPAFHAGGRIWDSTHRWHQNQNNGFASNFIASVERTWISVSFLRNRFEQRQINQRPHHAAIYCQIYESMQHNGREAVRCAVAFQYALRTYGEMYLALVGRVGTRFFFRGSRSSHGGKHGWDALFD